ncbi:DUF3426 domain-containing protein [Gynuella sp.]|uniref:DUF3426 domain-containing protein n=1 Tax=Gynuella sp. TaxID=2969146 RepID=UPI003D0A0E7D
MAESYITQCPHCGTTFKVTDQHLEAANGSVRCGACLRVFSAKNHLISESAKKPVNAADLRRPSGSSDKTEIPENKVVRPSFKTASAPETSQFEEDDDSDFLFMDDAHAPLDEDDDDIIFEDDPESDQLDELSSTKGDDGLGELSDEFRNIGSDSGFNHPKPDPNETETTSDDEAWAMKMLEEMEQGPEQKDLSDISADNLSIMDKPGKSKAPAKKKKPLPQPKTPEPKEPKFSAIDEEEDFLTADFGKNDHISAKPANNQAKLVEHIDTDPLDLDFTESSGHARKILYAVLSVVLVMAGVGQFAWMKFDTWAKTDQWRPYYAKACDIIGCQLPHQTDIQKIKTGNIIVRKHPKNPNGLIVDAILVNQAPFQQRYPDIILSFTDLNGKLVADAAFTPEQYLSGEAAGAQMMPSDTPIHIALAISNPGEAATNYTIGFRESQAKN